MLSLNIKNLKNFMSHLFIKNTFDNLLVCEADIDAACSFHIDGMINKKFYTEDELTALNNKMYIEWSEIKPVCYNMIKGKHTPSVIKIVFRLSDTITEALSESSSLSIENINGLYLNIKYIDDQVVLTTGSSIKIFTMDKTLDKDFDSYIRTFLEKSGISYDEN